MFNCNIFKIAEITFLIILLVISLIKFFIGKFIDKVFPSISLKQNENRNEIDINRDTCKHLHLNYDFVVIAHYISIALAINLILYIKYFKNFLLFYNIVIGIFLILMCYIIILNKFNIAINGIFQAIKDILSLLILKSLVYSQFTDKKVFREYYNCVLYYIKFYFINTFFVIIYVLLTKKCFCDETTITVLYFMTLFFIYMTNLFYALCKKNMVSLKFTYISLANIMALMFVISAVSNLVGKNTCMIYRSMYLSSNANTLNLILLMATNYRYKKFFKEE